MADVYCRRCDRQKVPAAVRLYLLLILLAAVLSVALCAIYGHSKYEPIVCVQAKNTKLRLDSLRYNWWL